MKTTTFRRRRAAVVTAVLALLAGLVVVTAGSAQAAPRPQHGFRTTAGWLGSHWMGTVTGFRSDASLPVSSGTYLEAQQLPHRATRAPAGWLLAQTTPRTDAVSAAATDLLVVNVLAGRGLQVSQQVRDRRMAGLSGTRRAEIMRRATALAARAQREAGPYLVSLRSRDLGPDVWTKTLEADVRTTAGLPATGVALTFSFGGTRYPATTDAQGTARATVRIGQQDVVAQVSVQAPDHRVWIRRPRNARQQPGPRSPMVVAGRRVVLTRTLTVAGVVPTRVDLTQAAVRYRVGQSIDASMTLTGGLPGRPRVVRATLVSSDGEQWSNCAAPATAVTSRSWTVPGPGEHALPQVVVRRSGWYRWSVAVAGDLSGTAASRCGSGIKVTSPTHLTVGRADRVRAGRPLALRVRVAGFDRRESHTLRVIGYGPFASRSAAHCGTARAHRGWRRTVHGNGGHSMSGVVLPRPERSGGAWYAFRADLWAHPRDLVTGSRSTCSRAVHVTR